MREVIPLEHKDYNTPELTVIFFECGDILAGPSDDTPIVDDD